jgi:hypothetical protein
MPESRLAAVPDRRLQPRARRRRVNEIAIVGCSSRVTHAQISAEAAAIDYAQAGIGLGPRIMVRRRRHCNGPSRLRWGGPLL